MEFIVSSDKDPDLFKIIINFLREIDKKEEMGQQKITTNIGDEDAVTPAQVKYLRRLGFKGSVDGMSKKTASDKITEYGG